MPTNFFSVACDTAALARKRPLQSRRECGMVGKQSNLLRCMSPEVARTGPTGPVWRCPLIGAERKWCFGAGRDGFDPTRTSSSPFS